MTISEMIQAAMLSLLCLSVGLSMFNPGSRARQRIDYLYHGPDLARTVRWAKVVGALNLILAVIIPTLVILSRMTGQFLFTAIYICILLVDWIVLLIVYLTVFHWW